MALTLAMLPRNADPDQENILRWMRGDGPLLLAKESLRGPLINYLETDPQAGELKSRMQEYMEFDMAGITKDNVFYEPNCFLALAAIYLGIKLKDVSDNGLTAWAKNKLADSRVTEVIGYYSEFKETAWIVEELKPNYVKN